jgi:long-chain fatty acid transport protein
MRRFHVWITAGVLAAGLAMPRTVEAQGYSVNEHGSCTMARGGTGVASPCQDGSAVVYNPAGLVLAKGKGVASGGATLITPTGDFTNSTTGITSTLMSETTPVPAVFMGYGVSDKVSVGFGIWAPYGLAIDWPLSFEGRFLGYHSSIKGMYLQPTAAWKVNKWLQLGAGFDITRTNVELSQRVDLAPQVVPGAPPVPTTGDPMTFANLGIAYQTDFADVQLSGDAMSYGYSVGMIIQPIKRVSLGIRYLSKQTANVDGAQALISQVPTNLYLAPGNPLGLPPGTPVDALVASEFQPGGPLVDQTGSTVLPYPAQLTFGLTLQATDRLTFLGDVGIQYWDVWQTLPLEFSIIGTETIVESYRNSTSWRVGGEYMASAKTTVRAGFISHNAAAPDQTVTPNLPEAPRTEFTAGVGSHLTDRWGFDFAYQYINQADRQGRTTNGCTNAGLPCPDPTAALNNGLYTFNANLFGLTLTYSF